MKKNLIFTLGGVFFILPGAIGLFFWIVSLLGGFTESFIPTFASLSGVTGLDLVQLVLMLVGSLVFSIGLILAGLVFIKIPDVVAASNTSSVEEKINKLQNIVWKVLQHVKKETTGKS